MPGPPCWTARERWSRCSRRAPPKPSATAVCRTKPSPISTAPGCSACCSPRASAGSNSISRCSPPITRELARGCALQRLGLCRGRGAVLGARDFPGGGAERNLGRGPDGAGLRGGGAVGHRRQGRRRLPAERRVAFSQRLGSRRLGVPDRGLRQRQRRPRAPQLLRPRSPRLQFIDDWRVFGLAGTGSKSVKVDNVFVPAHRSVRYDDILNGTAPGARVHPQLFALPRAAALPHRLLDHAGDRRPRQPRARSHHRHAAKPAARGLGPGRVRDRAAEARRKRGRGEDRQHDPRNAPARERRGARCQRDRSATPRSRTTG